MINGRMWLVVKPTVGIPLMLGGVVVSALSVHTAILANTTWFPAFLQGKPRAAASLSDGNAPAVALMKPGTPSEHAALRVK
jgi:light-harvesting protein B-800-850 alpha chain